MDLLGLTKALWEGFQAVGGALVGIMRTLLGLLGLEVPDSIVELATIIALLIVVFKFGKFIGTILLVILLLMLASTFIQLLIW
jgi:hypothetical protein